MNNTGKGALIGGGGGGALGAGIGALIGGGKGAAIGTAIGAAVGAGISAVRLPPAVYSGFASLPVSLHSQKVYPYTALPAGNNCTSPESLSGPFLP